MQSINDNIEEYVKQLKKGQIQKAYKAIMVFMSGLKTYLGVKHPDYVSTSLYFGYMDMTYFAFTPIELKQNNLKIALVYLHVENRFEVWLSGSNKKIQAKYIQQLNNIDIGDFKLSKALPGIDSIIEVKIVEHPNFDQSDALMQDIEQKVIKFTQDIISMVSR